MALGSHQLRSASFFRPFGKHNRFDRLPTGLGLRLLSWLVAILLTVSAWQTWTGKPRIKRRPPRCTVKEGRQLGERLATLAFQERVRAWTMPGLPARQAAWIAANAEFVLRQTKALDPKQKLDQGKCLLLLNTWRRLHRAMVLSQHGAREIPESSGAKLRAYVSRIDGSLQTYSMCTPAVYDPTVASPLIVSLHGHGWYVPYQGHPAPVFKGAFCASPHGRGATDYKDLGEDDVLRVIEEMRADYNIDPDRIYLRGSSMGGTGAWSIGIHHADSFAGLLPMAANADYQAWTNRWGWNAPFAGRFDYLRGWLQEGHTARAFAENLKNIPVYIMHGSADTIVPPEHSRNMWERLRQLGGDVEYREFPNVGHGGFPNSSMEDALAWICARPREAHPRQVSWKSDLMRHGKAYWLRMEQKRQTVRFASLDARVESRNKVVITTDNLLALSIQATAALFDPALPLFVHVDGERVIFPTGRESEAWLSLRQSKDGHWHNGAKVARSSLLKTAGVEGPIHEAFMSPFVIVVGTASADATIRLFWKLAAREMSAEWKRRNLTPSPFVRDVDVTPAMAASRNLILLGDARHNVVSAMLSHGVPQALDLLRESPSGDVSLPERLSAPDVGWFTVYPNPENPDRLVVMHGANGVPAIYQAWRRFGNWFNWGVFDSKQYFDYAVYDAKSVSPESLLLLGYYGTDWQTVSGHVWVGDSVLRAGLAAQHFPEFAVVPPMFSTFDLVDLHPAKIDQMRGAVAFGRTYHGQPLARGIGVRAPSAIEYQLDGTIARLITGCALLNSPENELCRQREKGEKVSFIIKGDKKVLGSVLVSWGDPQSQMDVDLTGVRVLRLEAATAGGPAWLHAGAAWLAPRLYR